MSLYTFVTQEVLDALPLDNPALAFLQFIRIAQPKFNQLLSTYSDDDNDTSLRYDFQTAVTTIAESLGLRDLSSIEIPTPSNYGYSDFRDFEVALNKVVAKIGIGNARRHSANTVFLPQKTRTTIERHLKALRASVETLQMDGQMRARLLKQLEDFEKALQAQRFQMIHVALLFLTVATIPGGIAATVSVIESIAAEVQGAVADEQERDQPLMLDGQELPMVPDDNATRPAKTEHGRRPSALAPAFESGGMDDDIPF